MSDSERCLEGEAGESAMAAARDWRTPFELLALGAAKATATMAGVNVEGAATDAQRGPLVLAGSSLGAYISGLVSLQLPVVGLFLMSPPIRMGKAHPLDAAPVPTSIIHGWRDELIAADEVIMWAQARRDRLLMVDDTHRLTEHVESSKLAFAALLAGF